MKPSRVALGFRPHSGWTAVVAVSGTARAPEVLHRGRIELCDAARDGSRQPYHAAEGLPLDRARKIVDRCAADAAKLAGRGFDEVAERLRDRGREIVGCGLILASGRPLPKLESILASHALIHTADGELFRDALRAAAEKRALPVYAVPEREVWDRAASKLRADAVDLQARIAALGKSLGPPWRQDEKLATAVALLAMASR